MDNNHEIFIISLEESDDRVQNLMALLDRIHLSYTVFKAVNGKNENHFLFNKYNHKKRMLCKGKELKKTQLGCYASHYLLWEKCILLNRPIIILEDDAIINPELFLNIYRELHSQETKPECVRLFKNKNSKGGHLTVENHTCFKLIKYLKGPMGTVGYFLTPSAAKKFIAHSEEWFLTVDLFMDRFWMHKVECYGTIPNSIMHDRDKFPSLISSPPEKGSNEDLQKKTLKIRICREIFNMKETILRVVHNTIFILFHLTGKIFLSKKPL